MSSTVTYIINWHYEKNTLRAKEYDQCIKGILKTNINRLVVLAECEFPYKDERIVIVPVHSRQTYADMIKEGNKYNGVIIFGNTDIYPTQKAVDYCRNIGNEVWALSRWDLKSFGFELFDRADSQDTWVFKTPIKHINCDFYFGGGMPGCDNRFAYEISKQYNVINPSKTVQFIHVHSSKIRNYGQNIIPPPYLTIPPTYLIHNTD
jgi:hypothetical protein